jgi:hypothetical protein
MTLPITSDAKATIKETGARRASYSHGVELRDLTRAGALEEAAFGQTGKSRGPGTPCASCPLCAG